MVFLMLWLQECSLVYVGVEKDGEESGRANMRANTNTKHNAWHIVGAQQISIESKQHTQLLIIISYVLFMTNLCHRIGIAILISQMT